MPFPSLPPLVWLVLSGVFFAGGEYVSKKYILEPHWFLLVSLLCSYIIGALLWLPALMQQRDLSLTGTLWSVISLCMTVLIGVIIFHEHITWLRSVGIGFAVASIITLSL
ncbi:MAG TPA: hypothetical protein VJB82_03485 [Candidatus Peribacterales bacterium]|nr:hypothetical protein [Candidatus Peribacterales bacterium]